MALPIPLILAAANLIPGLMKWAGVGESAVRVAEDIGSVATAVAGVSDPVEALKTIGQDPQKLQEFQLAVMEKERAWEEMYLRDTQSARERDVKMREAGYVNTRANVMLISAYIGVALCFFGIFTSDLDDYQKSVITLILGRMLGYIDQGFNFEFGTTRSSKTKDSTIEKLSGGQG